MHSIDEAFGKGFLKAAQDAGMYPGRAQQLLARVKEAMVPPGNLQSAAMAPGAGMQVRPMQRLTTGMAPKPMMPMSPRPSMGGMKPGGNMGLIGGGQLPKGPLMGKPAGVV